MISKCVVCRRFEGRSYSDVIPSPLPASRVSDDPAFTYVGVDFAGPLYVKDTPANKKSSLAKIYLTLFTCASSRAVHLDLVPELSTQAFIRCFHRFTARRGIPREMISENALTFKAAARHIARVLRQPEVKKFLSLKRITWKFNLARAPWWGGFFERMIKCVKRCLKKILGTSKLSYDESLTVVVDIEAILNSRPLTYLDSDDVVEPLTPSHLICGKRVLSFPSVKPKRLIEDTKVPHQTLNTRARYLASIVQTFWSRWRKDYLLALRESHNVTVKRKSIPPIAIGDMVIVEGEEMIPRSLWKLGRVEKLRKSKDGEVRGAVVKVGKEDGLRCYERPIKK